eukprot:7076154-Alexandrium_andersonii.AAC.1
MHLNPQSGLPKHHIHIRRCELELCCPEMPQTRCPKFSRDALCAAAPTDSDIANESDHRGSPKSQTRE